MKYLRTISILLFVITFTFNLSAQTALELLIKAEDSSDPKYSIDLAKQVIAIAEKENDKGLIASANAQIAFCLMNLGQLEEAEKLVDKITEMAESSGNPRALNYEWSVKGNIYFLKKDYANAFLCFEKALPYSQKLDDPIYVREILITLVNCSIKTKKDPSISIGYCNQALAYPDSKRGPNQRYTILKSLADINYYFLDNSSKAIDYYNQADAATDKIDQKVFIAQQIADVYYNMSNSNAAIEHLQKALNNLTGKLSKTQQADLLIKIATLYYTDLKDNTKAIEYYNQADAATDQPDQKGQIAKDISIINQNLGNLNVAIEYLQKALKNLNGKLSKNIHTELLIQLGKVYWLIPDFTKTIESFNQADLTTDDPKQKAYIAFTLGDIYRSYSNYSKAIEYLPKALKIYEELGDKLQSANTLKQIAICYNSIRQFQNSIDYYLRAIPIYKELDRKEDLVNCYSSLGRAYWWDNKHTEARGYAQQALSTAREINYKYGVMDALLSLSIADFDVNNSIMLDRLKEGYAIAKELEDQVYITNFETWIGLYYDIKGNYTEALPYYENCVARSEKKRSAVPDEMKLEYWAGVYMEYSNIIRCQLTVKDYHGTINSIEKSTARLLLERIAAKAGKSSIAVVDINEWQKRMAPEQAIVFFGNVENGLSMLTADATAINGQMVNEEMWVKTIKNKYAIPDIISFEKLRAFKKIQSKPQDGVSNSVTKPDKEINEQTRKSFEEIVNHYRSLLSKPLKTPADKEVLDFLGKKFYQLLIKPIEDKLVGKTELVIIPNDLLGFLPYEAFIMTDGRYMVEKYDIRYLPSLSVGNELASRRYSDNRKPILAFGNAIYSSSSSEMGDRGFKNISSGNKDAMTPSQSEFNELMKGAEELSKQGKDMKKYYDALGIAWDNLPGTLAELDAITALVPTATCIKGKDVNEQNVKGMSASGQLKGYKILHFATHGIVIPEYQDLSAIVLSQDLSNEDGYLRTSEIANLNLNADFVNLSACETGLGKIYGGEGVVGLTQSFLLAGANSIAVSLWKVSDQSTMEFQKEFYRLVFTEKMPISKAINQVKRIFIKGQYNQPFYWAPFVYYGM